MELSSTALAVIGLLLAAWTIGAAVLMVRAAKRVRHFEAMKTSLSRTNRMMDEAPAIPLLVRVDGRIEAPERLASWLGLDAMPTYLSELDGGEGKGLAKKQLETLTDLINTAQKTASPFSYSITPDGSTRSLALRGSLADPQVSPGGAALVWVFDFSDSESELSELRAAADKAQGDFVALVGLIEAAPMPMWFRATGSKLRLVNSAYVKAVGAENADQVIQQQIELLEPIDDETPAQLAEKAIETGEATERIVSATILGERRSLRVNDLPLGQEGVAGYAIDIEDMEQLARQFRAFRDAQRAVLDQLSIGVAQFDSQYQLIFANQPFHRLFTLSPAAVSEGLKFDRFLSDARERQCTPEVRDFPAWRQEHIDWFSANVCLREVARPLQAPHQR